MIVFKSDLSIKDTVYYLSVIDTLGKNSFFWRNFNLKTKIILGYWKMFAYKNQQYFLLFTQYETEVYTNILINQSRILFYIGR